MSKATVPGVSTPAPVTVRWDVFFIASVAVFLVSVDTTVLFAAFSALRAGFPDSSTSELSWVLNAYTVVYAALLVPAGRLVDARGRKRVFQTGLLLFLVASAACGASTHVGMLIAARALQAVGAALLTPSSLAIVLGAFPANRRAVAVSLWGAVGGLAAAIGPSAGASIVDALSWRWAFYINLPLGLLAAWYGHRRLVEWRKEGQPDPIDFPGVALLIIGVGGLAYGIVQFDGVWHAPSVLGPVLVGLLALGLFVAWARHTRYPAVDLSLFSERSYRLVNLATLAFGTAFSVMFFGYFFYLTQAWHYTLPQAGMAVTPGPLLVVPSAIMSGRIAGRIGHRVLLTAGCVLYALGGLWFYLHVGQGPDYLRLWVPGLVMTGIAVGMVLPSLSGAAVAKLTPARFGVGSAVNQAIRQVGSVLGVAITVVLVGKASPQMADFQNLFAAHIALAIVCALLTWQVDTKPVAR